MPPAISARVAGLASTFRKTRPRRFANLYTRMQAMEKFETWISWRTSMDRAFRNR
jgi:hypothetical protein